MVKFNRVTDRNANLPLFANKFFEKFASCTISSLLHFFSGYDQVKLNKKSQDLMAFITSLSFIEMTTFLQDATNFFA